MVIYRDLPDTGIRCLICGDQPNPTDEKGHYYCHRCGVIDQSAYVQVGTLEGLRLVGELELTRIKILFHEIFSTAEHLLNKEEVTDFHVLLLFKKVERLDRVSKKFYEFL